MESSYISIKFVRFVLSIAICNLAINLCKSSSSFFTSSTSYNNSVYSTLVLYVDEIRVICFLEANDDKRLFFEFNEAKYINSK